MTMAAGTGATTMRGDFTVGGATSGAIAAVVKRCQCECQGLDWIHYRHRLRADGGRSGHDTVLQLSQARRGLNSATKGSG